MITSQLHPGYILTELLCPIRNVIMSSTFRVFFFDYFCIQGIFDYSGCHRIIFVINAQPRSKGTIIHLLIRDIFQARVLVASINSFAFVPCACHTSQYRIHYDSHHRLRTQCIRKAYCTDRHYSIKRRFFRQSLLRNENYA